MKQIVINYINKEMTNEIWLEWSDDNVYDIKFSDVDLDNLDDEHLLDLYVFVRTGEK